MNTDKATENYMTLPNAPEISGLRFRHFNGSEDYPAMVEIVSALRSAGLLQGSYTLEDMIIDYQHLINSNPADDLIIAEVENQPIAYGRVWWNEENKTRVYGHLLNIHPQYLERGIDQVMLSWEEKRLEEIAKSLPRDRKGDFVRDCLEQNTAAVRLLIKNGYKPVRYFYMMSRDLENIPEAELPAGIEVRSPYPSQYKAVFDASMEAFKEHWGFNMLGHEEEYQAWQAGRWFQPTLWQVAWDGDQIVGQVQNYVDSIENEQRGLLRGYTEGISVHKDYRGKGIASALIVRSMRMMKALNLQEVALGVDTENGTGACRLYQKLGYQAYQTMVEYRKPMVLNEG